ncbi:MAG: alpha-amylase family glycosyl hydrolase, partial [Verrucomicrobiota bacterium]
MAGGKAKGDTSGLVAELPPETPRIQEAYWRNPVLGSIVLTTDWRDQERDPPLFFGPEPRPFERLERARLLDFGNMAGYFMSRGRVVFVLTAGHHHMVDLREGEVYVSGDFNDWSGQGKSEWKLKPTRIGNERALALRVPLRRLRKHDGALFKFVTSGGDWLEVSRGAPNRDTSRNGVVNYRLSLHQTGRHVFEFTPPRAYQPKGDETILWLEDNWKESHRLPPAEGFHSMTSELPMGVAVEGKQTTFRLFAPRANKVTAVYFSEADESDAQRLELSRNDGAAWEGKVARNLDGCFYYYQVEGENVDASTQFEPGQRILDPYALAAVSNYGPGIILSQESLPHPDVQFQPPAWQDLVMVEVHVRDLVEHAPIDKSDGGPMGFRHLERWVRHRASYLRSLGVNAVELQPVQEFDNRSREEYHWGYMPVNWFAPESSFGSDPQAAKQVAEFADLVQAFHDEGVSVILDVVYNHVGEPNHLLFIDKLYYFETDSYHNLMNWSGCGNDFRADTPMGRRMIIDSLIHLVKTYDVDGFRFDLAE